MADENTPVQEGTQETATTPDQATTQDQTDFQSKLDEMEKRWKSQIDGLNRRNSELEKEKQKIELETLSEKDRSKKELEIERQEIEKLRQEKAQLEQERIIEKELSSKKLPLQWGNFMRFNGADEESIRQTVSEFSDFLESEVQARYTAKVNKDLGGTAPTTGATPTSGLQEAYDAAMTKKDGPLATAILRQAQAQGLIIKQI